MRQKQKKPINWTEPRPLDVDIVEVGQWKGPIWNRVEVQQHILAWPERCFLVLDEFLLDVTMYMKEHVRSFSSLCICESAEIILAWRSGSPPHIFSTSGEGLFLAGGQLGFPKPELSFQDCSKTIARIDRCSNFFGLDGRVLLTAWYASEPMRN